MTNVSPTKSQNYFSSKNLCTNHQIKEPSETNINYLQTNNKFNNAKQLFDFISDKNKLILKSDFDRKGSEEFLCGKSEAMKKIELNEFIEEEDNTKNKEDKLIKEIKDNISEDIKDETKIKNVKTSKNLNLKAFKDNNLITKAKSVNKKALEKKEKKEEEEKIVKLKKKKHHKKLNGLKNINKENISIDSINTVNSKLFNNYKDYQKCLRLLSNDDISLVEEIIFQLNKEK